MPPLSIYALRTNSTAPDDFDAVIDREDRELDEYGPFEFGDFNAKLFVTISDPAPPAWLTVLQEGFGLLSIPSVPSLGAVVILHLKDKDRTAFALPFGPSGRFMLRSTSYQRGYGLRFALNLMYPKGSDPKDAAKLSALGTKRHGERVRRSRQQVSHASPLEGFDIDRLQDIVNQAVGRPDDVANWGPRVDGSDALHIHVPASFGDFGQLCRTVGQVHAKKDYLERFALIDQIQPITDPDLITRLEFHVFDPLQRGIAGDFELAPPSVVDWDRVASFRFHSDGHKGVSHPDLRLSDYLASLKGKGLLTGLTREWLEERNVSALEADMRTVVDKWSIWHCLVGQIELDGDSFVLEEGDFYRVDRDFLASLNRFLDSIAVNTVALPSAPTNMREDDYNEKAAGDGSFLLLDKKLVKSDRSTTEIEVCDLLSPSRHLIHVKRHLGSRDLSHLFAQGTVSAELLQEDDMFRNATIAKIASLTADTRYELFESDVMRTDEFHIVYAIVAPWRGRSLAQALPFFSKTNLRRSIESLQSRGYRTSCSMIDELPI
jgi:uncharacterized protein (TIGR04141 family)